MKNLFASAAMLPVILLGAPTATAQDADSESMGIGDIVVTAQKRSENIQDVPIAISAIGSQFLESRGITSIDALGTMAPNVKIERAPSSKTISQIAIRGSVTTNPAITWEPAVGLYVDGVYIAKAQGSIFDVADLERVEVLRGPQGTLYGRNALAGAVNLVTKKPSGEFGGSVDLSYGSYDQRRLSATLDLPRSGIFSAKVSGQIVKRDGIVDMVDNPYPEVALAEEPKVSQIDTINSYSLMAQVRAEISDVVTADYTFDYNRTKQRPPLAQLVGVGSGGIFDPGSDAYIPELPLDLYVREDRQTEASLDAAIFERSRAYGHALTLTAELDTFTIKSITAYRNLKWQDGIDLDGTPLDVAYTGRDTRFDAFSQELQVSGKAFDNRLEYVAGAFYYQEKAETLGEQRFFGAFGSQGGQFYQTDYGSHTKAIALFGQLDYALTDQFKLTLGARYTHEKKDVRRFFAVGDPLQTVVDLPYGGVPDAKYNNFSPAATLSWSPNQTLNVYARYARGFKSGGFNGETNVFFDPAAPEGCAYGLTELCLPYKPEMVDSYEFGVKTKLLGNRLIFNVAAFRDIHDDIQLSIFTADGAASSVVRNAASARIQGLEFEAILRPVDGVTLNGSFSLLDAKYNSYEDGGVDVSDKRAFPHAPKRQLSLGADWEIVRGDWGKVNLNGDLSHVSSYFTYPYALENDPARPAQNAYDSRSKGRTIVNLRLALSDVQVGDTTFELAGFVRNLTKEDNASNFIDMGPGFGGILLAYYPDPRTWGVSLGAKF